MASWITQPRFWYQGTKTNIGTTTITIHYEASMSLSSSNKESNASYDWYIYSQNSSGSRIDYATSTSKSGYVTLTVRAGEKNSIKAELQASYDVTTKITIMGATYTETKTNYLYGTEDGRSSVQYNASKNQYLQESGSYTLNAYTKNAKSSSSLWGDIEGLSEVTSSSSADYIDGPDGGDFKKIAADWLDQWQVWRSWYDQQDRYTTTTWDGVSLVPLSPISASWYNACASACGGDYTGRTGGYTQDIKAIYFRDISDKVTDWD